VYRIDPYTNVPACSADPSLIDDFVPEAAQYYIVLGGWHGATGAATVTGTYIYYPPPPPPAPPCSIDGAFTFTGDSDSYLTATSRTGLVGGGTGFTLSAWVYRTRSGNSWDRLIDFGSGPGANNLILALTAQ